jgi:hypothetical protein
MRARHHQVMDFLELEGGDVHDRTLVGVDRPVSSAVYTSVCGIARHGAQRVEASMNTGFCWTRIFNPTS